MMERSLSSFRRRNDTNRHKLQMISMRISLIFRGPLVNSVEVMGASRLEVTDEGVGAEGCFLRWVWWIFRIFGRPFGAVILLGPDGGGGPWL